MIEDHDAEPTRSPWSGLKEAAASPDVSPELLAQQSLTDDAINALLAERDQAKKRRDFARADQIRKELTEKGILIEDSIDGVRWKRK